MVSVSNEGDLELRINKLWSGSSIAPSAESHLRVTARATSVVLEVEAPYYGDVSPTQSSGSTQGLWNYEVVEWFVVGTGDPVPYLEVELGPKGHYLVLQLAGVRSVSACLEDMKYTTEVNGARWTGRAELPLSWLPPGPHTHNAFAIHGVGEHRVYTAAYPVPGEHPDFHRLECFHPIVLQPLSGE